jgi:prolyl oligopeptidase
VRLSSLPRLAPGFALLAALVIPALGESPGRPPATRAEPVADSYGGVSVPDPYRWLEDQNAPETRAWIDSQNAYSDSYLRALPGREALAGRLNELLKVDTVTSPTVRSGRYFFYKRAAGQDLPILYVRKGLNGRDEVLLDPLPLSPDHSVSISLLETSEDGKLIAYGVRQGGEDEVAVKFLDVDSHKELSDMLPRARYSGLSLTNDRKQLYYARQEKEGPRVYRHTMGADASRDEKIFGDGYGPGKGIGVGLSENGRYLDIVVSHGSAAVKTEVYVQDLSSGGPIAPIVNDVEARFAATVAGDRLFLETNWKAARGRVLAVDLKNPARENWKELVAERDVPIAGFSAVGGKLFVRYLENVIARVKVFEADGKPSGEIAFPSIGSLSGVRGEWGQKEAFFTFNSFATPATIYRYDVATGKQAIWAKDNVPVDSDRFEVKQVRYASKDGTMIPMFIVHAKGMKLDGSHPTLLTGYGGFTLSQTPGFSARAVLWVESGGVYALPNLRGGGEFGEEWHKAGMLDKKQNVFDDFHAAAEYLIASGYTKPEHLAISGGSNGGLLVGAALTQRPELFGAVVCSYPLLDMVRYHKFLVAGFWVPEYGSADNAQQFPALYAYSPYHHVQAGTKYPAVLFITGDADTRVAPLHARKMTALVQASTASDKPVLLHYDTKAGHSRGFNTPVSKQIEDLTDELAFLFAQTGSAYQPAAKPAAKKAA